jgi:hypothetical protein
MGPRTRKAIGSLGILLFLLFYVGLAAKLGAMLPNQWLVRLIYYVVAGTAWGAALIPLLTWMNRGRQGPL